MQSFTPSTVASNSSLLQPKIEANPFSEDDLHLGSFQKLETQLLDCMGISDQQPSHSPKIEVGDDYMHEPGSSIDTPSPGSKNSACLDDMPPKRVEDHTVIDVPIIGRSSVTKNSPDAPSKEQGLDKQPLKHADRLRKYLKENDKIPVLFHKKDGHPVGKYASVFMTELGIAVKKHAPLQVKGWKKVTEEQKRPMFQRLESAFMVDFSLGPRSVKRETDKLMSKRYRDYRQKMHRHYKTLTHLPWEDRLKHIPVEFCKSEADWEFMCKMFESETFKKYSVINSGNQAKIKPTYKYRGGGKSLSQYRYEAVDGSREEDGIPDSNVTNDSKRGYRGESAETANNEKQIGLDNHNSRQSLEEVYVATRACDQVRSGHTARPGDDLQAAKSTSADATASLIAANAELRRELASTQSELHSMQTTLQLTEDKVWILEANQRRLEETIQANTQIMEANQRMMKHVFEKLAFDIGQSLTAPPPPRP
ncbi:uncharacterized protein LOC131008848 isoform X2 [Salvia miltiorrhiza]|uniref:uncharacterized protein LOC131008848 isoform X2 n=1 Tax=Salvia miltiorrhiza TaxID=226208 RepID=UPI0025AC2F85|nr:uncharacterized protein LOC131008848 isoform X2 [Salvia miltiorrhiza]XP_057791918.1 uncharacterized protein LOC131008848 isoform X2 [Salvia miltiorrhiza]XP_057791919.1 uncharacterized protein LOC131008848 isoform X2 [Salvia miltiorrhiza]